MFLFNPQCTRHNLQYLLQDHILSPLCSRGAVPEAEEAAVNKTDQTPEGANILIQGRATLEAVCAAGRKQSRQGKIRRAKGLLSMGVSGQATLEGGGSEGEQWAALEVVFPAKEQQCKAWRQTCVLREQS